MIIAWVLSMAVGMLCLGVVVYRVLYPDRPVRILVNANPSALEQVKLAGFGIFMNMIGIFGIGMDRLDTGWSRIGFVASLGALFVFLTVLSVLNDILCTYPVKAVYEGVTLSAPGQNTGARKAMPHFSYDYNGVHYQAQAPAAYSITWVNKRFVKGRVYQIKINPKAPSEIKITNRFPKEFWLYAILSAATLIGLIGLV